MRKSGARRGKMAATPSRWRQRPQNGRPHEGCTEGCISQRAPRCCLVANGRGLVRRVVKGRGLLPERDWLCGIRGGACCYGRLLRVGPGPGPGPGDDGDNGTGTGTRPRPGCEAMEFPFDVTAVLGERFTVVDQHLQPTGRRGGNNRYRGVRPTPRLEA